MNYQLSEEFLKHIMLLRERIGELDTSETDIETGRFPFVIVVKRDLVAIEESMLLIEREGKNGIISMYRRESKDFRSISGLDIPNGVVYLLVDVDGAKETINVAPGSAYEGN